MSMRRTIRGSTGETMRLADPHEAAALTEAVSHALAFGYEDLARRDGGRLYLELEE